MIIPNKWKNKVHVPVTTNQMIYIYINPINHLFPMVFQWFSYVPVTTNQITPSIPDANGSSPARRRIAHCGPGLENSSRYVPSRRVAPRRARGANMGTLVNCKFIRNNHLKQYSGYKINVYIYISYIYIYTYTYNM